MGKSWGNLADHPRQRFDSLNSNAVTSGKNPSCDDSWGDVHIRNWQQRHLSSKVRCAASRRSY